MRPDAETPAEQAVASGAEDLLRAYAAAHPADGARLLAGLARGPRFVVGGRLLKLQPRAIAITLDTTVFCREPIGAEIYVHEVVHVAQYGELGVGRFLVRYFGLALVEIVRRARRGDPIDAMTASPLEDEAYAIEARFAAWARTADRSR